MRKKRQVLKGIIEYDNEARRFELIYENDEFYSFYLSDNLDDTVQSMYDVYSKYPDEYYESISSFQKGKSKYISRWIKGIRG